MLKKQRAEFEYTREFVPSKLVIDLEHIKVNLSHVVLMQTNARYHVLLMVGFYKRGIP